MNAFQYYSPCMKIKIVCFSHLGSYLAEGRFFDVQENTVVGDLPELLGFGVEKVAMFFVGDLRVDEGYSLTEGDVVKIFPPITGG